MCTRRAAAAEPGNAEKERRRCAPTRPRYSSQRSVVHGNSQFNSSSSVSSSFGFSVNFCFRCMHTYMQHDNAVSQMSLGNKQSRQKPRQKPICLFMRKFLWREYQQRSNVLRRQRRLYAKNIRAEIAGDSAYQSINLNPNKKQT